MESEERVDVSGCEVWCPLPKSTRKGLLRQPQARPVCIRARLSLGQRQCKHGHGRGGGKCGARGLQPGLESEGQQCRAPATSTSRRRPPTPGRHARGRGDPLGNAGASPPLILSHQQSSASHMMGTSLSACCGCGGTRGTRTVSTPSLTRAVMPAAAAAEGRGRERERGGGGGGLSWRGVESPWRPARAGRPVAAQTVR
jgi:hypothetical protein